MPEPVLTLTSRAAVTYLTLSRPEVRNAFNAQVISELRDAFDRLSEDPGVRAIVLAGAGKVFCGGADIQWMRGSLDLSHAENLSDAQRMSEMFRAIDRCNKPVIGQIHGAALGGGAGLAAVCDIVLAGDETIFGFTETKLGIIPAVISPFVLAKIGAGNARALFLTGERFDAARAQRIGLVHEVVPIADLEGAVTRVTDELLGAGPQAVAAAKRLIASVGESSYEQSKTLTSDAIAAQRTTPEGQEGLRAFLERRKAGWIA